MKISEFKELLTNEGEMETQKDITFLEGCSSFVFEKIKGMLVSESIDIDKRRHYETSIDVYKCADGFIGIRRVSQIYSESASIKDICYTPVFVNIEEVVQKTYIAKPF